MDWTQGLNPEQALAVRHDFGPMLILAGAGSGKTTVLVSRTGRLISERIATPDQILVLTFTNKSARELKKRVAHKIGEQARGITAGTFHSFGMRILREFHSQVGLPQYFGILDQSDSQSVIREIIRDIKITGKDKFDVERILTLVNDRRVRGKQKLEGFDEYHEIAEIVLPKFLKKLEVLGAVDFEGLLLKPLELFQSHPEVLDRVQQRFSQVMVDEFQDTNAVQMKLINQIIAGKRNISVVGDDDQSIYGWRGAEVKNILDFPKLHKDCKVVRLERNYRSSSAILDVANQVIKNNKTRHGKVLIPEKKSGHAFATNELPEVFTFETEDEEIDFCRREIQDLNSRGIRFQDIAILYRSNAQGGMLEAIMREFGIPYTVSGGTGFFDRKEVKDVLAYLRYCVSPNDVSLRRIINTPSRGLGDTTIEKISIFAQAQKMPFFKACYSWQKADLSEKYGAILMQFFKSLDDLKIKLTEGSQAGANLLQYLRDVGYRDFILQSSKPEAAEKKWLMLETFGKILDRFLEHGKTRLGSIKEFIDAMELRDEQEEEVTPNKVSLMTLHASKGLEFPVVFIVGVEEDLIPHRSLGGDIDEERRLFYVGLTRAQNRLILSHCKSRKRNGVNRPVSVSRFLLEIPKDLIHKRDNGFRPVTADQREKLVSDFLSKLTAKT